MPCPFCEVAARGDPTRLVEATEETLVLLDRRPIVPGHTLVIPRTHYERLIDIPDATALALFRKVQHVSRAILRNPLVQGIDIRQHYRPFLHECELVVRHIHVHVLPRRIDDALREGAIAEVMLRGPADDEAHGQIAAWLRASLAEG